MQRFRIVLWILLVAVIFVIGLGTGSFLRTLIGGRGATALNTATVIRQVQTLSQLVTVKYVMEKVVVLEDVKWYGENRVLMVANGVVKAGVDFSKLEPKDVIVDGKTIKILLPRSQITDAYLDETQTRIVERSTGLLRTFDKDLEQNARSNAVDDIRRGARIAGIQKDADERARAQVESLFRQMGFEQVEFLTR